MLQRTLLTSAIILIAGLLISLLVYQLPTRSASSTIDAWPPFTMQYREEGQLHIVLDGKPGRQTYRLVFNDTKDWTHEITDSTQKEIIGSYKTYSGETLVSFDASANYTTTTDTSKDEYAWAPDQWLTINYIKGLQQMPNVSIEETSDPTLAKLIETVESPCDPEDPSLTNCKPDQKVRTGSRAVTYRIDTLIPVLVVDKVDGETIYTATVEKLEFR